MRKRSSHAATFCSRSLRPFGLPSGRAASVMNLSNEVQQNDSEIKLSLTVPNAAPGHPSASVAEEESTAQDAVNSGKLDISGSQVLIGFLLGFCLVWLLVVGIARSWLYAR